MSQDPCLQEKFAPHNACFGCGPANKEGLRVRSFVKGDKVIAEWTPKPSYEAFPGVLNGGVIGALLDCHSNWTAAWHLMQKNKLSHPPCTVTAEYSIKLKRPAPTIGSLFLEALVADSTPERATIEAQLLSKGEICATCRGIFVAVKPGHPAYHRW